MSKELTMAAQQALEQLEFLNACYPHKTAADAIAALRSALSQRPAEQEVASDAQELAHNMMLWLEDARVHGSQYVPVHVHTLEKLVEQLREFPAPQQATPASAPQSLLMRLAGIAAECSDPDTTDALDALIATTQQATPSWPTAKRVTLTTQSLSTSLRTSSN